MWEQTWQKKDCFGFLVEVEGWAVNRRVGLGVGGCLKQAE